MTERKTRNGGLRNRFWYIGDLILFGLLTAYILYVHSYGEVSYRSGLEHNGALRFATAISIGMLLLPVIVLLFILLYRFCFTWSKRIATRGRRWKLRGLAVATLVFYGFVFHASIHSSGDKFVLGLEQYAKTSVDVPAIRAWLKTVAPEDCLGDMLRVHIESLPQAEQAKWPDAIRALKPLQASLHLDSSRHPVVRLAWGGWDEEYGVVVASDGTRIVATYGAQEKPADPNTFCQHAHYARPLTPGVCVYYVFD